MGRRIFAAPLKWLGFNRSAQYRDGELSELAKSSADKRIGAAVPPM